MNSFEEKIDFDQHDKKKKIGNYVLGKTLGKGTFGKVKVGVHTLTGEKVAIKILEKQKIVDVADVQRVTREIHILKLTRHPNIIQLYEIIQTPKQLFLVMEYVESGQLFQYIVKKRKMEQQEACKVFQQIISGVQYIHKLHIVHRDLKLENLLIDYDKSIRIVDFGLSNTYKDNQRLKTACGSPCYAAPEMIQSKNPYEPIMVDIWSSGVILYAMVCGFLPFQDDDQGTSKLYKKILSGDYKIPKNVSPQLRDFIQKILTVDPNKRIRIHEMKQHQWWRKYSDYYYPEGLIVGFHKIPIEQNVLKDVKMLNLDVDLTQKSLEANRHNSLTTAYYLLMKKFIKQGGISKADFSGKYFDKTAIQPNKRKEKNNSLKASDLIRKSSPQQKRSKSYYLDHHDENKKRYHDDKSLNHSVKVVKKRKSVEKTSKKKIGRENRSFSRDKDLNETNNDVISRKYKELYRKSMSRSQSKKKKHYSPRRRDISLVDDLYRPVMNGGTQPKQKNRKSHQGSYMIGADTGIDWPLEPKWKGQPGTKIRGVMRRK